MLRKPTVGMEVKILFDSRFDSGVVVESSGDGDIVSVKTDSGSVKQFYTHELKFDKRFEEFVLIWFETTQRWDVVFPDGTIINDNFGAMGHALGAALEYLGRGECEFEVTETNSQYFKYEKDEEFWVE